MGKGESAEMKKQNWPVILSDAIEEWKEKPFVWGASDCVLFTLAIAAAMVDYDLLTKVGFYAHPYNSEESAAEVLAQNYGGTMDGVFSTVFEEKNPKLAGRGDIVIAELDGVGHCGIVDSSGRFAACKAKDGILFVPMSKAVKAWGVE